MKVKSIDIRQYRNIEEMRFSPCEGANIIFGDNAQGKTNLLEAIWLFCGAKSFRGSRDSEMVRFEQEFTRLSLDFFADKRDQIAEIIISKEKKKISLNEIALNKQSGLSGSFCAVVFSPDQLSMVKQGPDGRRRFLDISLGQILPKYGKIMESFERILKQRAHLLKDCASHPSLLDTLEVWDNHMVQHGSYLCDVRARYAQRLEEQAREIYSGITGGKEIFSLFYKSSASAAEIPSGRKEWDFLLREAVKRSRGEDMRLGATTVGPHRDDLSILVNGASARKYASQGQQRSCVLSLKLAECFMIEQSVGEAPVVLLDDVMSELDEGRRSYLLNHLENRQVFITCCDAEAFRSLKNGRVAEIRDGKIT